MIYLNYAELLHVAGRAMGGRPLVRDAGLRADAVGGVLWTAFDVGLGTAGLIPSPIAGSHGNREFLVRLSVHGDNPTQWLARVQEIAG